MKPEQISDAIGKIDDDIVAEAAGSRKSKRSRHTVVRWIALAASVCLIFTGVMAGQAFWGRQESVQDQEKETLEAEKLEEMENAEDKQEQESNETASSSYLKGAIAQAVYPQTPGYPDEMQYIDEATGILDSVSYEKDYDAWRQCRQELSAQPEGYADGMEGFFEETIREFLTGENEENRVYSPLNVYMALSMLAEVTDGDSRQQILELLGVGDVETLRTKVSALWKSNYSDDGRVTSILGNSIWLKQNVAFQQPVLDTLAEYHYASSYQGVMGSDEMNQMLQDWLNEQTGGLLKEQVSNIKLDSNTIMALASSIYYKARWSDGFSKGATQEDVFHSTEGELTCEFMHQSSCKQYYDREGFSAVAQSLMGSGQMWLILPDEDVSVNEVLEGEDLYAFLFTENQDTHGEYLKVNLSVPKFDVVSSTDLSDGLGKLGVLDVFDSQTADFSPLSDEEIYVSRVEHGARVKIDEEGCEAAAFTVITAATGAEMPEKEVNFVLDRPFIFVITSADEMPLFAGVVNQPI